MEADPAVEPVGDFTTKVNPVDESTPQVELLEIKGNTHDLMASPKAGNSSSEIDLTSLTPNYRYLVSLTACMCLSVLNLGFA